jgi:hypothetical protein
MWRRVCPLLVIVLAAGLVLTRWRLNEAQGELERLRAEASAAGESARESVSVEAQATGGAAEATGDAKTAEAATVSSDLSSEWEQAVPPMDS